MLFAADVARGERPFQCQGMMLALSAKGRRGPSRLIRATSRAQSPSRRDSDGVLGESFRRADDEFCRCR